VDCDSHFVSVLVLVSLLSLAQKSIKACCHTRNGRIIVGRHGSLPHLPCWPFQSLVDFWHEACRGWRYRDSSLRSIGPYHWPAKMKSKWIARVKMSLDMRDCHSCIFHSNTYG